MNRLEETIREFHNADTSAEKSGWANRLHPLAKLCLTFEFLIALMSLHRYNLIGVLKMAAVLIFFFEISEEKMSDGIRKFRFVLPVLFLMGILNPIFDRKVIVYWGNLAVTGGVISMITLLLKGALALLSASLLMSVTKIDEICYALRMLHAPKVLITVILLIYRYLTLLLEEAKRMTDAYALRAPSQKGIHYKVWGSFLGQLLLRTMDRAQEVYESMLLRGYNGEFSGVWEKRFGKKDVCALLLGSFMILLLRVI